MVQNMKKIMLGLARKDVAHFIDILHLNGMQCEVVKNADGPTSVFITIPQDQFLIDKTEPDEVRFIQ